MNASGGFPTPSDDRRRSTTGPYTDSILAWGAKHSSVHPQRIKGPRYTGSRLVAAVDNIEVELFRAGSVPRFRIAAKDSRSARHKDRSLGIELGRGRSDFSYLVQSDGDKTFRPRRLGPRLAWSPLIPGQNPAKLVSQIRVEPRSRGAPCRLLRRDRTACWSTASLGANSQSRRSTRIARRAEKTLGRIGRARETFPNDGARVIAFARKDASVLSGPTRSELLFR